MTLTEAINLAKQGRSIGWSIIIHSTYNEKKFITSKYQETLLDKILHDSYVKALSNIHLLNDPEIFSSWLGIIIAGISTTELSNKSNISFSEIEPYENETLYLDVLNTMNSVPANVDLSEEDIKKISKKLFSSIKTEQKMCMLYHYVEGFSVKEIARALHCTEAAVISFLNAGIQKAETVLNHLTESYPVLSEFSNPVQLMLFILDTEYSYAAKEEIPDKAFNSIIEDTARIVAENYYKADNQPVAKKSEQSNSAAKKSNNTADDDEDEDEDEDDDDEGKAGLFGNKKMIFIIAVVLAIVAGLTIYFVSGKEKEPDKPSDSTSESNTVLTEIPTITTTEESTSEPSTEESSSDNAQPVVNQNPGSQSNNQQRPNNNTPQYRPPQNNNSTSNNSNQNNSSSNNSGSNNTTQNNQQTGTTRPANTVPETPPDVTHEAPEPPGPQIPDIQPEDPTPDIEPD